MSCFVEFWQELLGWQQPVPWALRQSFQLTFAALPRVWDTFHSIRSFSELPYGQQGFQVILNAVAWMWGASYLECFGSTLFGVLSAHLLGLVVAPRVSCGTMCMHTMMRTPMLCDRLSSWFLWVGLMFPEVGNKMDWMLPARLRTTMTPKTQKLGSFMGSFTTLPQCLIVGDRDDQPPSPQPVCSEPFCTQLKDTEWACFSLSEQSSDTLQSQLLWALSPTLCQIQHHETKRTSDPHCYQL